jgi:hypothetical protein
MRNPKRRSHSISWRNVRSRSWFTQEPDRKCWLIWPPIRESKQSALRLEAYWWDNHSKRRDRSPCFLSRTVKHSGVMSSSVANSWVNRGQGPIALVIDQSPAHFSPLCLGNAEEYLIDFCSCAPFGMTRRLKKEEGAKLAIKCLEWIHDGDGSWSMLIEGLQ